MKTLKPCLSLMALVLVGTLAGCSTMSKSADVADSVRKGLDQAGFKDVSASQDRDKGVVTLMGHVTIDAGGEGRVVGSECPAGRERAAG